MTDRREDGKKERRTDERTSNLVFFLLNTQTPPEIVPTYNAS
jgi:hypothetical protein